MNPPDNSRVSGFDLARAFAFMGMVIVNFKVVMGASHEAKGWWRIIDLLDGRAAATFVVLAGVGVSLATRRAWGGGDAEALAAARRSILGRAGLLFALGLAYLPIWPADILHFYGAYLALGAAVLNWRSRPLLALAAALTTLFPFLLLTLSYDAGWRWESLTYTDFWTPSGFVRNLGFNGFHPVIPWAALLLLGMALGRQDFQDPATRRRLLIWGFTLALAAEGLSWALIRFSPVPGHPSLRALCFGTHPMPPMPLYILAGAGSATAFICLCVAWASRFPGSSLLRPLIHTGQLALTLYVAHVVLGMGLLEALGRLERQSAPFALASALAFCGAAIPCAHLWRLKFQHGPLEAALRKLTTPLRGPVEGKDPNPEA